MALSRNRCLRTMAFRVHLIVALLACAWLPPVRAAPYVPADDALVLERLPFKAADPVARELRELRARVAADPTDARLAAALARRYFRLAMATGDPRYIGYGEAVLRPWWDSNEAMHDIIKTRALIKQYRHDFAGALTDFALAGRADPTDEEVWSWRAALHIVQAKYTEAAGDCAMLKRHGSQTAWAGCQAWVDGMTGKAKEAYAMTAMAHARYPDAGASARLWTLTRLAELALRRDDAALAERHFKEALAIGVDDQYLLAAYADFLLDQDRPREVLQLLKHWGKSDVLLLRLALADQVLNHGDAGIHARALQQRFAAAAMRGDSLHLQEEARFCLHVLKDPVRALSLARANWALQREARDARILVEAALAAGDHEAAKPALAWLESSGHEDPTVRRLARQFATGPR